MLTRVLCTGWRNAGTCTKQHDHTIGIVLTQFFNRENLELAKLSRGLLP